jgi:hypothetical protein
MDDTRGQSREDLLKDFVDWTAVHIEGDEKGEAQTFIDHLFGAFGQQGAREVGGTFEERIKQLFDDKTKTSFADYVWKPVVLIEMKKRGADLAKHRQQAFNYWTHIAPGRPKSSSSATSTSFGPTTSTSKWLDSCEGRIFASSATNQTSVPELVRTLFTAIHFVLV